MIELDGTPDKRNLGANSIVGVSLAAMMCGAESTGQQLYRYIGGANAVTMPIPIWGLGTGGRYRDPGTSRWFKPSYEYCAYDAGSYENALFMSWQCEDELRRLLRERYPDTYSEQYHKIALAGVIKDDRELLDAMTTAINNCGYEGRVGIYFDCAADCYYEADIDKYVGHFMPGERTREEQIALLKSYVDEYPIVSLEDPLREEDFEGIAMATEELGIEIVGDDLFTTNIERLKQGIAAGAAQSMVLKITQIGTVSEAFDACRLCLPERLQRASMRQPRRPLLHRRSGRRPECRAGARRGPQSPVGHRRRPGSVAAVWPGKAAYKGVKNQS